MIKNIFTLFAVCFIVSCATEPISEIDEHAIEIAESSSLRASLEAIKTEAKTKNNTSKQSKRPEGELCFQFVYPITLSYNTGATVEVVNYEQLLELVLSETLEKHFTGIGFPFDIELRGTGALQTITDESEFLQVIENCGYDTVDYERVLAFASSCFSINYPLSLIINDSVVTFSSETEGQEYFLANYSSIKSIQIDYSFSVTLTETEEVVAIADDYEFIYLINETCGIN